MRNIKIANDEYYHLCNRGVHKQNIFINEADWRRLLFTLLFFQSPFVIEDTSDEVSKFAQIPQHRVLPFFTKKVNKIHKNRAVELVAFALMPNHFHLLVKQVSDNGISQYMQRVQNSYTKYFNTKHKKSGHLFQGPFRAIHIEDNDQILYTSAYIHLNPIELKGENPEKYKWSSYQDYLTQNRWGDLLNNKIITEQFKNPSEYQDWVKSSGAKDKEDEMTMFPE